MLTSCLLHTFKMSDRILFRSSCACPPFYNVTFFPVGTTSEEGVIFVYSVFNKPVSAVESTVYVTAIFKQHALRILHKYLPLYRDVDHRGMLAQVRMLPLFD